MTVRCAREKFAAVQMIDVYIPTTDDRKLLITRCIQPEPELLLLLRRMKLILRLSTFPKSLPQPSKSHPL